MKEIIAKLRTLNDIDLKLATVRKDMERLPRELAEKRGPIALLKGTIERAKADLIKLKIEADSADLEVKAGEEALKRLANQMSVLRTSKEWDTIRRQMDAQRGWNKDNENKELGLLEQVENKQKEIEANTAKIAELEAATSAETASVEKTMAELQVSFDELNKERETLTPHVPDAELATYSRIVSSRGTAIAHVAGVNCSACYMRLPAQFVNLALLGRELVTCPSCGRILTAMPKN